MSNPYDDPALTLNIVALQAVNKVALAIADATDRSTQEIDNKIAVATKPIPRKLLIDLSEKKSDTNEDILSLRLLRLNRYVGAIDHDGASNDDVEKCRTFPQKRYVANSEEWLVPITPGNVAHLLASWRPEEYELLMGAKLMLDIYFTQQKAQGIHLSERAEFMATGVAPQLDDYLFADNDKPPMSHQKVGFSSARYPEFFSLIMDPGTGKTRIIIDVLCDRARKQIQKWAHENGLRCIFVGCQQDCCKDSHEAAELKDYIDAGWQYPQFKTLVLAPRNVLRTWIQQLGEWSTLDVNCEALRGSKLQRAGLLATLLSDKTSPLLVALINYEGIEVVEEFLVPIDGRQIWDACVADESWKIKNPSAKLSQATYRVGAVAKARFIMNGTPISKNVLDLYGQYHFLKPGILGYTSFNAFQEYYGEKNFFGGHKAYKTEKLPELQERLARCSLVVKKTQCPDLPPEVFATISPELGDEARSSYEQMAEELIVDLDAVEAGEFLSGQAAQDHQIALLMGTGDESRLSHATIVLVKMLRLAQITSGFLGMKDKTTHVFKDQPKLDALEEHLAELQDDQRIVIWSRFRDEIDRTCARFKDEYGACPIYGGLSDSIRNQRIDAHARGLQMPGYKSPTRILVIQPQSGGAGMNDLIGTTDVNYLSNEFSWMLRKQSQDRTHRMGVKQSVLVNDFVIPNTIDELIWSKLQAKKDLSDLLTDAKGLVTALKAQLGAMRTEGR